MATKTAKTGRTDGKDKAQNQTTGNSKKGKAVQDASNLGKIKTFKFYDDDMNEHEGSLDMLKAYVQEGSELDKLQDGYNEYRDKLKEKRQFFGNIMVGVAMAIQKGKAMNTQAKRDATAKALNDTLNTFWKDNFGDRNKPQYFSQTKSNCSAAIKLGLNIKDTPTAGTLNKALNEERRRQKAETPATVADAMTALKDTVAQGNKAIKDNKDTVSDAVTTQWSEIQDALIQSLMELQKDVQGKVESIEKSIAEEPTAPVAASDSEASEAADDVEGNKESKAA